MTSITGIATEFINFTRASNATVTDSDGKIKWAPHNLLTNSESFDNAAWGKYLTTVSANTQSAPNGTTTADTVTASAGNDVHRVQRASGETTVASTNYSLSVFVKAGTHNFVTVGFFSASEVFVAATFNLASGSAATETDVGTTSGTVVSTEKVDVGSGWFRLSITGNYNGTSASVFICFAQAATGNSYSNFGQPVVNLAGTETFHIWGAHLYRSDLGGMQANTSAYPMYNPTTPKNLLGFSEDFGNAAWTKSASTITANAILAPNGLQTADKIVATNSASTTRGAYQSVTPVSGGRYVASVYAKAAEYDKLTISEIGAGRFGASFDLTAQTATSLGGAGYVSSAITSVGDGWFRCSVVWTASGGAAIAIAGYPTGATVNAAGTSYAGDGTSGIYLWGAQLSDSASLDPYVPDYDAAPTAAAYYGPRRDFDPVTLACKGLLVEEQRTNLVLQSAAPNVSPWTTGANTVVTAASGTSPDGTLTACRLNMTAASGTYLRQSPTLTVGQVYTFSCYAKAYGSNCQFTLGNSAGASSALNATSSWQRYSYTFTAVSADYVNIDDISSTTDLLVWGFQCELGSFATSYIPTGAATATRSADVASVSTQAFPYSSTEGAIVVNASVLTVSNPNTAMIYSLYNDGNNFVNSFIWSGAPSTPRGTVTSPAGPDQANLTAGTVTANTAYKSAFAYKVNDFAFSVNGAAAATDTSGTLPNAAVRLELGSQGGGGTLMSGHIRQITYLPRRISNAELIARTQ